MPITDYEPVIGLEIHVQINTKSKMFCSCDNDAWQKKPNTTTCPICMGFPGMLPVTNKEAVHKGVLTGLALHCQIPQFSKFDRKNYFYPDSPKSYQISQYDQPIALAGYLDIEVDDQPVKIGITRLHLEDDAGKLTHTDTLTLCDFNRSGTPLMEIVSEPDMHSAAEAVEYAKTMRAIVKTIDTSQASLEKGHMRFDVNVSIRQKGTTTLGTRTETKNLNSFRSLEHAITSEIKRQADILDSGGTIIQETRSFDDTTNTGKTLRSKEEADDYRYFPEPDLPPIIIPPEEVATLRKTLPPLPLQRRQTYIKQHNLTQQEAIFLTSEPELADFFDQTLALTDDISATTRWVLNEYGATETTKPIYESPLTPEKLAGLITAISSNTISGKIGKDVFATMIETGQTAETIITKQDLKQVSDTSLITKICQEVIDQNPQIISDIKSGKGKALGFLVGQVMQKTKGQANPRLVNEIFGKLIQ